MTSRTCAEYALLIQADMDGELDAAASATLAAHVVGCAACTALRDRLAMQSRALRADLPRYEAPASLSAALAATAWPQARAASPRRAAYRRRSFLAGLGFVAGAAIATVSIAVIRPALWQTAPGDATLLLASHLRALEPGHLIDVVSTDQHTVKPWFDGRLAFSPPVADFARQGFPLLGGRLDYVGTRQVAVLVYRHAKHIIDVYVWPAPGDAAPRTVLDHGYRIVSWTQAGFRFHAVSDVDPAALRAFVGLWRRG